MDNWRVSWVESGTNERRTAGPFETEEEARRHPLGYAYPPITATIQVWRYPHVEVSP
jgi:hypothetical protein